MLVLFTDFTAQGPYVGLLKSAALRYAPHVPIIDLFHDIAAFDVQGAAYLLAQYALEFETGTVFIGVVDPGVGSARAGLIVEADGRLFVGPDNGLFDRIVARAENSRCWKILWHTSRVSPTFHGRDIFAPVAAMLAQGTATPDDLGEPFAFTIRPWPDELARIIYVDRYGNAMSGIRASAISAQARLRYEMNEFSQAHTYSDVPLGDGFWYANSSGLVEIAVNQGMASVHYGLTLGTPLEVIGATKGEIRVR